MSKNASSPSLRIVQSVATIEGAQDSLESINTFQLSDRALVVAGDVLYQLRKDSTATESLPGIVAPAQGGPGRWFAYGAGPTPSVAVQVFHAAIGPQSSVDSAFSLADIDDSTDLVLYNLTDSGLPAGVGTGPVRITGTGAALMRFVNATGATVAAATVAFRMSVSK